MSLVLYNSLTRKKEVFHPIHAGKVGMYTCGPTIYDRKHIGNFRTYTTADFLVRVLKFSGYEVTHIMNFTDVGHLTGDNEGDADQGEDRLVKAAKRERKTAWDIAKMYEDIFLDDFAKMGLLPVNRYVRATDHIQEQINMIQTLEEKGFAYQISDGVYFDTQAFEEKTGSMYGQLSTLDEIKEGARVGVNSEKHHPRDFALWKKSPLGEKRDMEWESPWGIGFPGWHIECSAMSIKYLGETFDIHVGGEDLRSTHHPNEIAQSEGATSKPFVHYWLHSSFVLIDGGRMSTSLGNNYKVQDIIDRGYDPLVLRYLYMMTHYRKQLNFTWEALAAADHALRNLQETVCLWDKPTDISSVYEEQFRSAMNDDLNFSTALAVLWQMVHDAQITSAVKSATLLRFDQVLGLQLSTFVAVPFVIPEDVQDLAKERERARQKKDFALSDLLRQKIQEYGFLVEDTTDGPKIRKES